MVVTFYFGPGSRYSYLASTQIASIAARTGACFRWKAVYSEDVRQRAGNYVFGSRQGQYAAAYRDSDVQRWARHYGVPFREPRAGDFDWRLISQACVAADLLEVGEGFGRAMMRACFVAGDPPRDAARLAVIASEVGLSSAAFEEALDSAAARERYEANVAEAVRAGAFGVPTFVTEDGALFWGQDRLLLLERHLSGKA